MPRDARYALDLEHAFGRHAATLPPTDGRLVDAKPLAKRVKRDTFSVTIGFEGVADLHAATVAYAATIRQAPNCRPV